jgi:type II secretory pathway pseudopilin PulG
MLKQKGSVVITLVVILGMTAMAALYWAWGTYQNNKMIKQQQVAELIQQQQQIVLQQRALHGDLPEEIITAPIERHKPVEQRQVTQSEPLLRKNFSCDGREHCSQMRSYEEAVFFNQYCPNTKMDGDNDGLPCERQFNR